MGEDESRLFTKIRNEFHKWSAVIEKKFQRGEWKPRAPRPTSLSSGQQVSAADFRGHLARTRRGIGPGQPRPPRGPALPRQRRVNTAPATRTRAPVPLAPEQRRLGLGLLAVALKAGRISVHFMVAAAAVATQRTRNTPEASPCSTKSSRVRKRWKCDLKFMFPYFKKLKVNRVQTSDKAAAAEGNFKEPCFIQAAWWVP